LILKRNKKQKIRYFFSDSNRSGKRNSSVQDIQLTRD
jgi:hypothetical protein